MIALPQALPFIRIGNASLALCQKDWITKTLTNATQGTNVPEWLAEDISRGVERFLSNHYKGTVIDSEEFFERIEKTLSQFGLSDVAENIDKTPPPVRISLNELARRAGTGYELIFFQLLQEQLESAKQGGVHHVECHGIKPCVKRLIATKKWSKKCDSLRDEITDFLNQAKAQASAVSPEMTFMVAS